MSDLAPHETRPVSQSSRETSEGLSAGTEVCVWNRSLGKWTGGFEIAEVLAAGFHLRRLSDGHVFGEVFPFDDVMRERRRNPMRGITGSYLDRRHEP